MTRLKTFLLALAKHTISLTLALASVIVAFFAAGLIANAVDLPGWFHWAIFILILSLTMATIDAFTPSKKKEG